MARAIHITALYLAIAYALMLTYQVFTETALTTMVHSISTSAPTISSWLSERADVVVFVCTFAWTFVLSSVVSALIFRGEKRISIQFFVSLALTGTATLIFDFLKGYGVDLTNPNNILSSFFAPVFGNVFFAVFYLCLPYIFMVAVDLRLNKKIKFPRVLNRRR